MQGALKSVKGVKEATVSLEKNEAVVTYDPAQCKTDDLIRAVRGAKGMAKFDAKVKAEKKP